MQWRQEKEQNPDAKTEVVEPAHQAQKDFETAMKQYEQDMKDDSTANTDCVGTTIDDFNHVHYVQCK